MELNLDLESIPLSSLRTLVSFRSLMSITSGIKPKAPRYFFKSDNKI